MSLRHLLSRLVAYYSFNHLSVNFENARLEIKMDIRSPVPTSKTSIKGLGTQIPAEKEVATKLVHFT